MLSDPTATDYRDALNFRLAAQNPRPALPTIQIPLTEGRLGNPFGMEDKRITQFHVKGDDIYYSLEGEDKIIYVADLGSRHKVRRTINLKSMPYSVYENQWGILGDQIYGLAKTSNSNVPDAWFRYGIDSNILRNFLFPISFTVWSDIEPVENFASMDKSLIFDYDNDRILLACYNVGRNTFTGTFTMPAGEFTSTEGGSFDGSGASYDFGPLLDFDTSYLGPDDEEDDTGWVDIAAETSRDFITPTFSIDSEGQEYGAVIVTLNDDNTFEHFLRDDKPVMWFFRSDSTVDGKPHVLAPAHMDKDMNSSKRLVLTKSYVKGEFLYANTRVHRLTGSGNVWYSLRYLGPVVWHFKTSADTLHSYLTNLTYRYMWDYTEDSDNRASAGVEPVLNVNDQTEVLRISPVARFATLGSGVWNNESNVIPVIEKEILTSGVAVSKSVRVADFEEQDWIEDVLAYANMVVDEDSEIIWYSYLDRAFDSSAIEESQPTGYTSIIRYNTDSSSNIEFSELYYMDWHNPPGGYSFDLVIPENLVTFPLSIGIVRCDITGPRNYEVDRFYTIIDHGTRYASEDVESPYILNATNGLFQVRPGLLPFATPGIDNVKIRCRLSTGQFVDTNVRIILYDSDATTAIQPTWENTYHDFVIARDTPANSRVLVGSVSALGADTYRTATGTSNNWDLEAKTGNLYWIGSEAIPDDQEYYNFVVEAANSATGLDEGVSQTPVLVTVED